MRVIKHLHKDGTSGFTRNDGWNLKTWERNFEGEKVSHKVDYLIHTNGHVITSQYKAYNDYVRMAMMIDLIFKPAATANGGKLLMWCDNCSIHTSHVEKLNMGSCKCCSCLFATKSHTSSSSYGFSCKWTYQSSHKISAIR